MEREAKQMTEKKGTNNNIMHPASRADTNAELNKSGSSKGQVFEKHVRGNTAEQNKNQSPDRKDHMPPKMDSSEKKIQASAQNGETKQGTRQGCCRTLVNLHLIQFTNIFNYFYKNQHQAQ